MSYGSQSVIIMEKPRNPLRASLALSIALILSAQGSLRAEKPSPFFQEVQREFQTMRSTGYQHRTQVDRITGSYRYDCVGFVSYALKIAAPRSWETVVQATGISRNRFPSPQRYRIFFESLVTFPRPGWQAVTKTSELRPGDIVIWEHHSSKASGHAVVIASNPVAFSTENKKHPGEWIVEVYDSTSSPHGEDSRPNDPRAGILAASERRSGLGSGIMVFTSDPTTGNLNGLRWNPKASRQESPIAAARPTS